LRLDESCPTLAAQSQGTRWDLILQTLCGYRLILSGSECGCIGSGLSVAPWPISGEDFSLVEIHKLYEWPRPFAGAQDALFSHLQERWKDLFKCALEVLLYDLTSTYFESDPRSMRR